MHALPLDVAIYFAVKLAGYIAWCTIGLRLLDPEQEKRAQLGLMWGTMRLAIGLVAGLAIRVASYRLTYHTIHSLPVYFAIFVPLALAEWTIIDVMMRRGSWRLRDALWIAIGTVVSLAADLPIAHLRTIPIDRVIG